MQNPTYEIRSIHNPKVKEWSGLLHRKGRTKQGKYLIEGIHLVEEALHSNAPVETIVYSLEKEFPSSLYEAFAKQAEWIGVSQAVLQKCSDTETPQGIFAVVKKNEYSLESITAEEWDLAVVADGIQDPGNLGTIIRSADAVGASVVVLGQGTVDLYNPKTIRSTMGSLFHLPVIEADLKELLPKAVQAGIQVLCTDLKAEKHCYEIDFTGPTWIILGNEGKGTSQEARELATQSMIIPMKGHAESLNVAMAATVLLFEASRQRMELGKNI